MKTLLMSDVHIGFKFSRAKDAVEVLENEKFDRLILVGDIFDIENMMKRPYWDEHHTAFLKKILKLAKKMDVIYVIGNHDYPLYYLQEYTDKLAKVHLCREFEYESGGKKITCVHGDQFDSVSHRLQSVGDFFYNLLLHLNTFVAKIQSLFGMKYWSLSKWCKNKVKSTINKAFSIEEKLKNLNNSDVVVYGHTHMPYVTDDLVNTGTFVEIATYVIEKDGVFTLKDLDEC
jgi:UDP-2,3-diacylglucosamine pyrophosphatase LpxH